MKIIITGSSGYIGSCLYEVLKKNQKYKILCLDKTFPKLSKQKLFKKVDLNNYILTNKIFKDFKPDAIIHLAAQSTIDFIDNKNLYIKNNIGLTKNLIKVINNYKSKYLIFSSTAAVYQTQISNLNEKNKLKPNNIYGKTKLDCEKLIKNNLNKDSKFVTLRFFNVCSALIRAQMGEFHNPETHFIPIIVQKMIDKKNILIYGKNFKTRDGFAIRDYIHIKDIIRGIILSLIYLTKKKNKSVTLNLGTERGHSNLEIINKLKELSKNKIKFNFYKKRPGDLSRLVCNNKKAKKVIGWEPKYSNLKKILVDEFLWQNYLKKQGFFKKTIYYKVV